MKGTLTAAVLLVSAGQCFGQDPEPLAPWYLGLKGGVVNSEQEADDGILYGLELGRQFNPYWSVELDAFIENQDFDQGFEVERQGVAINLIQTNREPIWNPYFLLGLGALRFETDDDDDTKWMINLAIGGIWELHPAGLTLRADLRYRYAPLDARNDSLVDDDAAVFSLGLQIPLGR